MGWRMPSSIWQSEGIPYQPTRVGTTCFRQTFDTVLDCTRVVNGMRFGAAWWDEAQGAGYLLPKQEIHRLWIEVFTVGKDVLRTSVGSSEAQAVHALPHHLTYCEVEPYQIHFWEAFIVWKDCEVASSTIRIWHPLCIPEGHQRKRNSQLSSGER